MRRSWSLSTAGALAVVLTLPSPAALARPAAQEPDRAPATTRRPAAVADAYRITLITGDAVDVTTRADGTTTTVVAPGTGREGVTFAARAPRGGPVTVIPGDAQPLLAAGLLDPRLFDVTGLRRLGYDDRQSPELPLILGYPTAAARALPPATRRVRELPAVRGSAVRAAKNGVGRFWRQVSTAAVSTAPATPSGRLGGGLTRIWLDGGSRIDDSASNAQIGVPVARERGLNGSGVTLAVLDTGYDAGHPDLAARVTAARDFTGAPAGAADGHGHGTHVATIAAGTGAASAGRYAGVAPEARLLVGKVCRDNGLCPDSAVIAGMEWAAAQGARVVNLSLSSAPTDGTDPLSVAVNQLTASTGTLFVAAAGNNSIFSGVGSPAAADAALAVGSVGADDGVSYFSNQGPRAGDGAVKPDLTAPGDNIVAGRAAGTRMGLPVDGSYTAASGTSMAAPHVAGAAALLAQAHPDWTPGQLKTALTSTAVPNVGHDVFAQGAGRLDVGRAVTASVYAAGAGVSFGTLAWPYPSDEQSRTVTYHNTGPAPVTLSLSLAATGPVGPAAGLFRVSAPTVTVPARGSADVTVHALPGTVDVAGNYGGWLTASAADGTAVARTAVGLRAAAESYDLTVRLVDRDGEPARNGFGQNVTLFNDLTGESPWISVWDGVATARVPRGRYQVTGFIRSPNPDQPDRAGPATIVHQPAVDVDADRTITLDARTGELIDVRTDRRGAQRRFTSLDLLVSTPAGQSLVMQLGVNGSDPVYVAPVAAHRPGAFAAGVTAVLTSPEGTAPSGAYAYHLAIPLGSTLPAAPTFRVRDADLARVEARYRAQGAPARGSRGAIPFYLPGQSGGFGAYVDLPLPTRRTEYVSPGPVVWMGQLLQRPLEQEQLQTTDGLVADAPHTYTAGQRYKEEWNRGVIGPELRSDFLGNGVIRFGDQLQVMVNTVAPAEPGHSASMNLLLAYLSGTTVLSKDGAEVGSWPYAGYGQFVLPPERGTYTLDVSTERPNGWAAVSTRVDTRWTFTTGADEMYPSLLTTRVTGAFDDLNAAPAGARFPITITPEYASNAATARVRVVTVEMSADDGATWSRVRTTRDSDGTWRATVRNPAAGAGFVSLRVSAADSAGSSVRTTVLRAYRLR